MKKITIETSTYKYGTRLVVSLLDEKNAGSGTRIKGAKFNDFASDNEILVDLNIEQAKELVNELQYMIDKIVKEEK